MPPLRVLTLAKAVPVDSGWTMPATPVAPVRKKKSNRSGLRKPVRQPAVARTLRLDLDADETALHAAISTAVARDLGR